MESNKSRTDILISPGSSIDKNIRFYNLSTEEQYLWCDLTIDMLLSIDIFMMIIIFQKKMVGKDL